MKLLNHIVKVILVNTRHWSIRLLSKNVPYFLKDHGSLRFAVFLFLLYILVCVSHALLEGIENLLIHKFWVPEVFGSFLLLLLIFWFTGFRWLFFIFLSVNGIILLCMKWITFLRIIHFLITAILIFFLFHNK